MSNMRQVSAGYFQYIAESNGRLPNVDADAATLGKDIADSTTDFPYLRQYVGNTAVFHCPEDIRGAVRTYSVNDYLGGTYIAITHALYYTRIANPPRTLLLIEEARPVQTNVAVGGFVILPAPLPVWIDPPGIMHDRGTCLCMADGHVEYWVWLDERTLHIPLTGFPRTPNNPDLVNLQAIAGSKSATVN